MHILVTGASGFIGRNLVHKLLSSGHAVSALIRQDTQIIPEHPRLSMVQADLNHPNMALKSAVYSSDAIIHLAGDSTPRSSAGSLLIDAQNSLIPTLNLLEIVKSSTKPQCFLYASSGGTVYGRPIQTPICESHPTNPTSPYGIGKLMCEHMVRIASEEAGIQHIVMRISNPYGPYQHNRRKQGVIGAWIKAALANQSIEIWGDGSTVRDYLYIEDAVRAMCLAVESRPPSGIYNLGSGVGYSLKEITAIIQGNIGRELNIVHKPMFRYDISVNILSVQKLTSAIPWSAHTQLSDGIAHTIRWMSANPGSSG